MSEREFVAYQKGETLRNETDHRANGEDTTSVGFCFFPEDPDDAVHWLSGIVNPDVCCTFDVPDDRVKKTSGVYCDHEKSDNSWGALFEDYLAAMAGEELPHTVKMERTEYCCTEYSKKDFRLVGYKYSGRLEYCKQCDAEWERKTEDLPDGILLQGTTTDRNMVRAYRLIGQAVEKTPLSHGSVSLNVDYQGDPGTITLPDGRKVNPCQRVEVHADGTILIDGRLLTPGFPSLSCSTGTSGEMHWCLGLDGGSKLEVPFDLWKKYDDALRNG